MPSKTTVKELWLISFPLIITNACFVIMQFADRVMLSRYSADALAACVPAGSLSFTFVSVFMGLAGYTGVFIAQYHGQKKKARLTQSLWQGVWVSLISGALIICLMPAGLAVIEFFKHEPAVMELEKQYFTIMNMFGGFIVLNNALSSFFTGRGKTAQTMYVTVAGNIVNVFLSYILIFGRMGFSEGGIKGAAYGTGLAEVFITLFYVFLLSSKYNRTHYRIDRLAAFSKEAFLRLLRFGLPNGFGYFMDVLSFSLFSFIAGAVGAMALSASNIALTMQFFVFMPMMGLSLGVLVLVGKYMGEKDTAAAAQVTKNACKMGFLYSGFFALLFLLFPRFFINMFMPAGTETAISELAVPLVRIVALFTFGDTLYLIFGESIRGAGDTKFHMMALFVSAWVIMMPGTAFIVYKMHGSIFGVWSWFTCYALLTGVIMFLRWRGGKWKTIDITA